MIQEFQDIEDINILSGETENLIFNLDEDDVLTDENAIKISSYITHEACRLYHQHFHNNQVPLTFIEFIFNEYKRYPYPSSSVLQEYFNNHNDDKLEIIVDTYAEEVYSVVVKKSKKPHDIYYKTNQNVYSQISIADSNFIDFTDKEISTSLNQVTHHLNNSDEILTLPELYDNYLMKKELKQLTNQHLLNKPEKYNPEIPVESEEDTYLVGESTDLPNQKGKVVKVFFPKLTLPSPYPITAQDKSRINSDHRAKSFVKIDTQVQLMNKHKINGVKYKQAFIDKRKAAQKPPKRKFDFDF